MEEKGLLKEVTSYDGLWSLKGTFLWQDNAFSYPVANELPNHQPQSNMT